MLEVKKEFEIPTIDLTGPDGNVFYLIGTAKRWAKQLGKSPEVIVEGMMSKDYQNAVAIFELEFGHICKLIVTEDLQKYIEKGIDWKKSPGGSLEELGF